MLRRVLFFVLALSAGLAAGLVLTGRMRTGDEAAARTQPGARPIAASPAAAAAAPAQGLPDLTAIAERAVNAVTSITSTQTLRSRLSNDPLYRFFYGDQIFEREAQSLGSGVIVSADGLVVTNNHVIGDGRPQVSVMLADKRELPARIIGTDAETDLAVLRIDARNLPTLPWGDSSKLKVAEWVLAIGNPFGVFNQTVTLGIVSATGRSVEGLGTYEAFIQTDAAINRGNSGGALINARGELVGINSAIYSETGGYQGIGLAVPSNLVRKTMDQLVREGVVRRGTILGIQLQAVTPEIAGQLGLPDARGLLVTRLSSQSEAAAAGLRRYDVIASFNGTAIEGGSQFLRMLSEARIGSIATLVVIRDGRQLTLRVPIEESVPSRGQRR